MDGCTNAQKKKTTDNNLLYLQRRSERLAQQQQDQQPCRGVAVSNGKRDYGENFLQAITGRCGTMSTIYEENIGSQIRDINKNVKELLGTINAQMSSGTRHNEKCHGACCSATISDTTSSSDSNQSISTYTSNSSAAAALTNPSMVNCGLYPQQCTVYPAHVEILKAVRGHHRHRKRSPSPSPSSSSTQVSDKPKRQEKPTVPKRPPSLLTFWMRSAKRDRRGTRSDADSDRDAPKDEAPPRDKKHETRHRHRHRDNAAISKKQQQQPQEKCHPQEFKADLSPSSSREEGIARKKRHHRHRHTPPPTPNSPFSCQLFDFSPECGASKTPFKGICKLKISAKDAEKLKQHHHVSPTKLKQNDTTNVVECNENRDAGNLSKKHKKHNKEVPLIAAKKSKDILNTDTKAKAKPKKGRKNKDMLAEKEIEGKKREGSLVRIKHSLMHLTRFNKLSERKRSKSKKRAPAPAPRTPSKDGNAVCMEVKRASQFQEFFAHDDADFMEMCDCADPVPLKDRPPPTITRSELGAMNIPPFARRESQRWHPKQGPQEAEIFMVNPNCNMDTLSLESDENVMSATPITSIFDMSTKVIFAPEYYSSSSSTEQSVSNASYDEVCLNRRQYFSQSLNDLDKKFRNILHSLYMRPLFTRFHRLPLEPHCYMTLNTTLKTKHIKSKSTNTEEDSGEARKPRNRKSKKSRRGRYYQPRVRRTIIKRFKIINKFFLGKRTKRITHCRPLLSVKACETMTQQEGEESCSKSVDNSGNPSKIPVFLREKRNILPLNIQSEDLPDALPFADSGKSTKNAPSRIPRLIRYSADQPAPECETSMNEFCDLEIIEELDDPAAMSNGVEMGFENSILDELTRGQTVVNLEEEVMDLISCESDENEVECKTPKTSHDDCVPKCETLEHPPVEILELFRKPCKEVHVKKERHTENVAFLIDDKGMSKIAEEDSKYVFPFEESSKKNYELPSPRACNKPDFPELQCIDCIPTMNYVYNCHVELDRSNIKEPPKRDSKSSIDTPFINLQQTWQWPIRRRLFRSTKTKPDVPDNGPEVAVHYRNSNFGRDASPERDMTYLRRRWWHRCLRLLRGKRSTTTRINESNSDDTHESYGNLNISGYSEILVLETHSDQCNCNQDQSVKEENFPMIQIQSTMQVLYLENALTTPDQEKYLQTDNSIEVATIFPSSISPRQSESKQLDDVLPLCCQKKKIRKGSKRQEDNKTVNVEVDPVKQIVDPPTDNQITLAADDATKGDAPKEKPPRKKKRKQLESVSACVIFDLPQMRERYDSTKNMIDLRKPNVDADVKGKRAEVNKRIAQYEQMMIAREMEYLRAEEQREHDHQLKALNKEAARGRDAYPDIFTPKTREFGMTYYHFRSALRNYTKDNELLRILTPCVNGQMQKAPKAEHHATSLQPALVEVSSQQCQEKDTATSIGDDIFPELEGDQEQNVEDEKEPLQSDHNLGALQKQNQYLFEIHLSGGSAASENTECRCKPELECQCRPEIFVQETNLETSSERKPLIVQPSDESELLRTEMQLNIVKLEPSDEKYDVKPSKSDFVGTKPTTVTSPEVLSPAEAIKRSPYCGCCRVTIAGENINDSCTIILELCPTKQQIHLVFAIEKFKLVLLHACNGKGDIESKLQNQQFFENLFDVLQSNRVFVFKLRDVLTSSKKEREASGESNLAARSFITEVMSSIVSPKDICCLDASKIWAIEKKYRNLCKQEEKRLKDKKPVDNPIEDLSYADKRIQAEYVLTDVHNAIISEAFLYKDTLPELEEPSISCVPNSKIISPPKTSIIHKIKFPYVCLETTAFTNLVSLHCSSSCSQLNQAPLQNACKETKSCICLSSDDGILTKQEDTATLCGIQRACGDEKIHQKLSKCVCVAKDQGAQWSNPLETLPQKPLKSAPVELERYYNDPGMTFVRPSVVQYFYSCSQILIRHPPILWVLARKLLNWPANKRDRNNSGDRDNDGTKKGRKKVDPKCQRVEKELKVCKKREAKSNPEVADKKTKKQPDKKRKKTQKDKAKDTNRCHDKTKSRDCKCSSKRCTSAPAYAAYSVMDISSYTNFIEPTKKYQTTCDTFTPALSVTLISSATDKTRWFTTTRSTRSTSVMPKDQQIETNTEQACTSLEYFSEYASKATESIATTPIEPQAPHAGRVSVMRNTLPYCSLSLNGLMSRDKGCDNKNGIQANKLERRASTGNDGTLVNRSQQFSNVVHNEAETMTIGKPMVSMTVLTDTTGLKHQSAMTATFVHADIQTVLSYRPAGKRSWWMKTFRTFRMPPIRVARPPISFAMKDSSSGYAQTKITLVPTTDFSHEVLERQMHKYDDDMSKKSAFGSESEVKIEEIFIAKPSKRISSNSRILHVSSPSPTVSDAFNSKPMKSIKSVQRVPAEIVSSPADYRLPTDLKFCIHTAINTSGSINNLESLHSARLSSLARSNVSKLKDANIKLKENLSDVQMKLPSGEPSEDRSTEVQADNNSNMSRMKRDSKSSRNRTSRRAWSTDIGSYKGSIPRAINKRYSSKFLNIVNNDSNTKTFNRIEEIPPISENTGLPDENAGNHSPVKQINLDVELAKDTQNAAKSNKSREDSDKASAATANIIEDQLNYINNNGGLLCTRTTQAALGNPAGISSENQTSTTVLTMAHGTKTDEVMRTDRSVTPSILKKPGNNERSTSVVNIKLDSKSIQFPTLPIKKSESKPFLPISVSQNPTTNASEKTVALFGIGSEPKQSKSQKSKCSTKTYQSLKGASCSSSKPTIVSKPSQVNKQGRKKKSSSDMKGTKPNVTAPIASISNSNQDQNRLKGPPQNQLKDAIYQVSECCPLQKHSAQDVNKSISREELPHCQEIEKKSSKPKKCSQKETKRCCPHKSAQKKRSHSTDNLNSEEEEKLIKQFVFSDCCTEAVRKQYARLGSNKFKKQFPECCWPQQTESKSSLHSDTHKECPSSEHVKKKSSCSPLCKMGKTRKECNDVANKEFRKQSMKKFTRTHQKWGWPKLRQCASAPSQKSCHENDKDNASAACRMDVDFEHGAYNVIMVESKFEHKSAEVKIKESCQKGCTLIGVDRNDSGQGKDSACLHCSRKKLAAHVDQVFKDCCDATVKEDHKAMSHKKFSKVYSECCEPKKINKPATVAVKTLRKPSRQSNTAAVPGPASTKSSQDAGGSKKCCAKCKKKPACRYKYWFSDCCNEQTRKDYFLMSEGHFKKTHPPCCWPKKELVSCTDDGLEHAKKLKGGADEKSEFIMEQKLCVSETNAKQTARASILKQSGTACACSAAPQSEQSSPSPERKKSVTLSNQHASKSESQLDLHRSSLNCKSKSSPSNTSASKCNSFPDLNAIGKCELANKENRTHKGKSAQLLPKGSPVENSSLAIPSCSDGSKTPVTYKTKQQKKGFSCKICCSRSRHSKQHCANAKETTTLKKESSLMIPNDFESPRRCYCKRKQTADGKIIRIKSEYCMCKKGTTSAKPIKFYCGCKKYNTDFIKRPISKTKEICKCKRQKCLKNNCIKPAFNTESVTLATLDFDNTAPRNHRDIGNSSQQSLLGHLDRLFGHTSAASLQSLARPSTIPPSNKLPRLQVYFRSLRLLEHQFGMKRKNAKRRRKVKSTSICSQTSSSIREIGQNQVLSVQPNIQVDPLTEYVQIPHEIAVPWVQRRRLARQRRAQALLPKYLVAPTDTDKQCVQKSLQQFLTSPELNVLIKNRSSYMQLAKEPEKTASIEAIGVKELSSDPSIIVVKHSPTFVELPRAEMPPPEHRKKGLRDWFKAILTDKCDEPKNTQTPVKRVAPPPHAFALPYDEPNNNEPTYQQYSKCKKAEVVTAASSVKSKEHKDNKGRQLLRFLLDKTDNSKVSLSQPTCSGGGRVSHGYDCKPKTMVTKSDHNWHEQLENYNLVNSSNVLTVKSANKKPKWHYKLTISPYTSIFELVNYSRSNKTSRERSGKLAEMPCREYCNTNAVDNIIFEARAMSESKFLLEHGAVKCYLDETQNATAALNSQNRLSTIVERTEHEQEFDTYLDCDEPMNKDVNHIIDIYRRLQVNTSIDSIRADENLAIQPSRVCIHQEMDSTLRQRLYKCFNGEAQMHSQTDMRNLGPRNSKLGKVITAINRKMRRSLSKIKIKRCRKNSESVIQIQQEQSRLSLEWRPISPPYPATRPTALDAGKEEIQIGTTSFIIRSPKSRAEYNMNSQRTINSDIPSLKSYETNDNTWRPQTEFNNVDQAMNTCFETLKEIVKHNHHEQVMKLQREVNWINQQIAGKYSQNAFNNSQNVSTQHNSICGKNATATIVKAKRPEHSVGVSATTECLYVQKTTASEFRTLTVDGENNNCYVYNRQHDVQISTKNATREQRIYKCDSIRREQERIKVEDVLRRRQALRELLHHHTNIRPCSRTNVDFEDTCALFGSFSHNKRYTTTAMTTDTNIDITSARNSEQKVQHVQQLHRVQVEDIDSDSERQTDSSDDNQKKTVLHLHTFKEDTWTDSSSLVSIPSICEAHAKRKNAETANAQTKYINQLLEKLEHKHERETQRRKSMDSTTRHMDSVENVLVPCDSEQLDPAPELLLIPGVQRTEEQAATHRKLILKPSATDRSGAKVKFQLKFADEPPVEMVRHQKSYLLEKWSNRSYQTNEKEYVLKIHDYNTSNHRKANDEWNNPSLTRKSPTPRPPPPPSERKVIVCASQDIPAHQREFGKPRLLTCASPASNESCALQETPGRTYRKGDFEVESYTGYDLCIPRGGCNSAGALTSQIQTVETTWRQPIHNSKYYSKYHRRRDHT